MADTVVQYVINVSAQNAEKSLENLSKDSDRASKSMDRLGDESIKTGRELDSTSKKSTRTTNQFKKLGISINSLSSGIGALGAGLGIAAGAVIGLSYALIEATKASFNLSREVVDSVNQLNDLSSRSGLAAGSIQALIQAFEGSGQSAQSAESFISRFPRLLSDLQAGSLRSSEAAKQLGISITDLDGNLKGSDQILKETISSLQSIEDDTQRAVIATDLFGRSAGGLLQALGKTAPFEAFLNFTNEFGVQTLPKASQEAGRFQQLLAAIGIAANGLKQSFVNALGGVGLFNRGLKSALIVIVSLQEFIRNSEQEFGLFGKTIETLAIGIVQFFSDIFLGLSRFIDEIVSRIAGDLLTTISVLESLGVISGSTFDQLAQGLALATKSARELEEGIKKFAETDITREGTAGGRVSANIDKILEGISDSINNTIPDLENFDSTIQNLDNTLEAIPVIQITDLESAFQTVEQLTEKFSNISPSILQARKDIEVLEIAISDLAISGLDSSEAETLLLVARQRLKQATRDQIEQERELEKERRRQRIEQGANIFDMLATGSIAGIASLINPLAGQIIGTLESIGSKTPDERREELLLQVQAIRDGISFLPEIFLSVLPQMAIALTEAIYDGTIRAFQNLLELIADSFSNLFSFRDRSPDGDNETLRERAGDFLRDFFDPSKSASFASGGRFIPSAQGGIRFTGMNDGLAQLHRGEFVVPQSGQRPQQVDRQLNQQGGGMNITINSLVTEQNAIDSLVRQIENRFNNSYGQASSNLFGGR